MWPTTRKTGQDSISGLLPVLVALSCLSAGWLLGYGLSPSTKGLLTSPAFKIDKVRSTAIMPAFRQDSVRLSDAQRTKKIDSDK